MLKNLLFAHDLWTNVPNVAIFCLQEVRCNAQINKQTACKCLTDGVIEVNEID
jgi:hypothetical protein